MNIHKSSIIISEFVDFTLINGSPRLTVGQRTFAPTRRPISKAAGASLRSSASWRPVRSHQPFLRCAGMVASSPARQPKWCSTARKDSLIFTVQLWNTLGAEPTTIAEVLTHHKESNIPAGSQAK